MAVTVLGVLAERWVDTVVLSAAVADAAGASMVEDFTLPVGIGDVAIMSVHVLVTAVATAPLAGTVARGTQFVIRSPDGSSVVDLVGLAEWFQTADVAGAARFDAWCDPGALVLWRQGESLRLVSSEMDRDVAPTGDLNVRVKVVRVKPQLAAGRGSSQLVR